MQLFATNRCLSIKGKRGFALLVVIIVLLLVSFLASQLILKVRTESRIVYNTRMRAGASFLAQGGVNLALFRLFDTPIDYQGDEYANFVKGINYEAELPNGKMEYMVTSEAGKIDLNRAPRGLLEIFFEYYGLDPDQIDTVIDSLVDWRDSDDLHGINGAEKETYENLDPPYIPRNGEIQDPAEFFLVHGTGPLVGRFKAAEVFTVHNLTGKLDYNNLTPAMLDFIAEGDPSVKEAYQEAKSMYGTLTEPQARQVFGDERYDRLQTYFYNTASRIRYYSIIATGKPFVGEDEEHRSFGPTCRIDVLIDLGAFDYRCLSWKEQYL